MNLDDAQQQVIAFRNARGWQKAPQLKDSAISLNLEAAELLEHFQWKSDVEFKEYLEKHKDEVADELIDVLYWVLLMCHDLNISIEDHFKRKMTKNAAKYPL